MPDFALGVVRQDQQRATGFEDEVLGNVVRRRIGFPQRQNREVMQPRLLDQVSGNFNRLAPHETMIVRNSLPYCHDLEGAEQIARVRRTFLRVSREKSADVKRIGIEPDRRLNVHLIRKGGYARLQSQRELNRVLYRLSFRRHGEARKRKQNVFDGHFKPHVIDQVAHGLPDECVAAIAARI